MSSVLAVIADRTPDPVLRAVIRRRVRRVLAAQQAGGPEAAEDRKAAFLRTLAEGPVTQHADAANEQHYEVPAEFYRHVLGPHLKYSCARFDDHTTSLAAAEQAMLALTCRRARIGDGQHILELGCGWGSLTLWMAARHPTSRIVAVSNSSSQRAFITERAAAQGLDNVEVVTADIADFEPGDTFDRVVSVEMMEHVRNHRLLLARIARWLKPDGSLFVHVFSHREWAYPFDASDRSSWMARNFFSGGIMPSHDLFLHHQQDLLVDARWRVDGRHYEATANAWLANLDAHRSLVEALFRDQGLSGREARRRVAMWRLFFLACAELFGLDGGAQFGISHYRMVRP